MSVLTGVKPVTNFLDLLVGYYTIVFAAHNTHRTIRITRGKFGHFADKLIISKMNGTDNTSNYVGIGNIDDNGSLRVWQKAGLSAAQVTSLRASLEMILTEPTEAGKQYALRSGNCWKCNRLLTNPESILAGIGPECIKKI